MWLDYGLDDGRTRVMFPAREEIFFSKFAHLAPYLNGAGSSPGIK